MQEEIDHFGHVYDLGQTIPIDGNVLLLIGKFMTEVIQKETEMFASFSYALSSQEIKDEDGKIIRVESDMRDHNKTSFQLTAASDSGAQLGLTSTGVKASQILSGILHMHEQNIKNKIAKKQEDINAANVFKA